MTLIELKKAVRNEKAQRTRLISKRNVLFSEFARVCFLSSEEKTQCNDKRNSLMSEIEGIERDIKGVTEVIFDLERRIYAQEEKKAYIDAVIAEAFYKSKKAEEEGNKVEAKYWYNLAIQSKNDMESEGMAEGITWEVIE